MGLAPLFRRRPCPLCLPRVVGCFLLVGIYTSHGLPRIEGEMHITKTPLSGQGEASVRVGPEVAAKRTIGFYLN